MIPAPLPRVREATVRIVLGDGSVWTWTLTGPLAGAHAVSDRDREDLWPLEVGPDVLDVPRVFPLQIAFAFALPLSGDNPATLHIQAPADPP